jgi:hypothetical protein
MSQLRNEQQWVGVNFEKHILQVRCFGFFTLPNNITGSHSFSSTSVEFIPMQAMKVKVDVEVWLQSFVTSARDMIELTSRPGRLTQGKEPTVATK